MSVEVAEDRPADLVLPLARIFVLTLICLAAIAAGYGWFGESRDYKNYESVFAAIRVHDDFSTFRFERGYLWSSWFSKYYLGLDFAQFYSALVALSLLLKARLLWKHASAPVLAVVAYLLLLYPFYEYTQLRAAVAFAFAYTAVDCCLDGKWFSGVLYLVVGVLFHTSSIVISVVALLMFVVAFQSPGVAALLVAGLAGLSIFVVSLGMHVLKRINPLLPGYINKSSPDHAPTLFSGENILLCLVLLTSALFLRPWQTRIDRVYYFMSFWAIIVYIALMKLPLFAHRLAEAFIFAFLLFAFRFDHTVRSRMPAVLLFATSGWMLYEALSQEWLFAAHR